MEENNLELLYDHYKETDRLRLEAQSKRNTSFVICSIIEAVSFFFLIQLGTTLSIFQGVIKEKLGITVAIGNNVFQTLLWLLLAFYLIRYVQNTVYVERQYDYQSMLEKQLDEKTESNLFGREGRHYSENYPNSLNLIDLFYKVVSPILFLVINLYRIITEFRMFSWSVIIDSVLCVSITIILWAFFFDIHRKTSNWCREHVPGFSKTADWIRKELKKV